MKKKLQKKEPIRSFQSKAPDWIISIYNTVQSALNLVLENKTYRDKLIKVDLTRTINGKKQKISHGTLWKEIQAIIGNPLKDKINNAAWYNRIMMTNIIFLLESRQEQIKVAQILKENNNVINQDLRAKLTAEGLYPSNAELQNLVKSKDIPVLSKHVVLKLDYAFADKQMFYLDNDLNCHIQVLSKKEAKKQGVSGWKMFQIYIPTYIRKENLIKVCKPMFVYSKKRDQMICQIPYQVVAESHPEFQNTLGIDMGKVKPYSATVLYRNSNYSQEYEPSNRLDYLNTKLSRLNKHIKRVFNKMKRAKKYYNLNHYKQELRYIDYAGSREKRTRLKVQIEWLMAEEIVDIAYKHQCKEIHLENLTWVNNKGGKWDFSSIAQHVNYVAELKGIKVVLVPAKNTSKEHPVTKELGKAVGRDIVFEDGQRVDRDQLAGLNIALKKSGQKVKRLYKRKAVQTHRRSRRKQNYLFKQSVLKSQKDAQIVAFLYDRALNILALVSEPESICSLDNNLAKRGFLKLDRKIAYQNLSL